MRKLSAHYFVADAHLGAGTDATEEKFLCFLENIRGRAESLYVLGDLFDFWFEYRRVVSKHCVRAIAELTRLRRAGTRVLYLRGNHDFRFGEMARRELEVSATDSLEQEVGGLRVWMSHGDALDRRAVPVLFRAFSRSRTVNWLYSLLHPDMGMGLATWVSRQSRQREPDERLREVMADFARVKLSQGFDVVILAHSHLPELRRFDTGTYLNVGDWLRSFSYGVIRNGTAALEYFDVPPAAVRGRTGT